MKTWHWVAIAAAVYFLYVKPKTAAAARGTLDPAPVFVPGGAERGAMAGGASGSWFAGSFDAIVSDRQEF